MFSKWLLIFLGALGYGGAMEVQGHRGSRGTAPENSFPSFLEAIHAGADAIELDLLTTKDGIVVVHHDYFVNQRLCQYLTWDAN